MSLGSENSGIPAVMNVAPSGTGYNNGGWGGDWSSWIILFLIFGMFGWGGFGGFGGWGGMGMGGMMGGYPVESILQRSLDTQTIIGKLDGVTQGLCDGFYAQSNAINGLGMNVMQGFHGVDNAICGLGNSMQQGFNSTNIAMMQGNNATQMAIMQGNNALQGQLAQCCCDNRAGLADLKYQMATDTCAVQNTIQNTTRDVIDNQNANSRAILDALNQNYIRTLENENQALKLSASQSNQNAVLMAAMDANKAEILRRTGAECPTPAYVVQPPTPVNFPTSCCGQFAGWNNGGCNGGCGC